MMQRSTLLLLFLLGLGLSAARAQVFSNPSAAEMYQKAEIALLENNPEQALRFFDRALKIQPGLSAARRGKGLCYAILREYPKAVAEYEQVLASDSLFSRALYYQAGEAHYKAGNHKKALAYFQKFEALQQIDADTFSLNTEKELAYEEKYLKKLNSNVRACEVRLDSIQFINITEVVNLGPDVNTKDDDYFPFITNDQEELYFTRKSAKGDEDLYRSRLQKGQWARGNPVKAINTELDEGMISMVRDGRLLFFTACNRDGVLGICDIWQAIIDAEGEVTEVGPLDGYTNSEKWESQAAISCDGSTLFFASERPGGFGKSDLWYSKRQPDGRWSNPVNLGPKINTDDYEEAPFITNDGRTLYFSSYGHPGMGDQDIFMSWLDDEGNWSDPINLGPPVNTAFRELGFFLSADGKTGYFSSERPEGYGKLDIYKFQLTEQLYSQPITFLEGLVLDSALNMPVRASVEFADRPPIEVGPDGRFFLCIPAGDSLNLSVNKKYFHPYQNLFLVPEWDNKQFYTIEILLKSTFSFPPPEAEVRDTSSVLRRKSPVVKDHAHTIFFDFDKTTIDIEELGRLDAFLKPLKGKNIQRIEVIGYADDIGTDVYNLKLSEERAKQTALAVRDNGLIVDKIYMEGRGAMKNGMPKEENRKVELKVTVLE